MHTHTLSGLAATTLAMHPGTAATCMPLHNPGPLSHPHLILKTTSGQSTPHLGNRHVTSIMRRPSLAHPGPSAAADALAPLLPPWLWSLGSFVPSKQADIFLAQQDLYPRSLLLLPPDSAGPAAPPSTRTPPSPNTSALSMGASTQKTSSSRSAPHLPHPRARVRAAREKPSCWMPPASHHSSPPGWQHRRSPRLPQSQQQQQQQPHRGRIMHP